jgi:hypothetical protein
MSIFKGLIDWLGWSVDDLFNSDTETTTSLHEDCGFDVNPATGLPILGCSGLDVQGNPYGVDLHHHDETWLDTASNTDTSTDSLFSPWDE